MKQLVEQIISFAKGASYEAGFDKINFIKFIELFYAEAQLSDFANCSIPQIFEDAKNSFSCLILRPSLKPKTRIASRDISSSSSKAVVIDIINDDMPFLVDSIVSHLDKNSIEVKNIIHPICLVLRDQSGTLVEISDVKDSALRGKGKVTQESIIQIHLAQDYSSSDLSLIEANISKILDNVALVVADWKLMVEVASKVSSYIGNAQKLAHGAIDQSEIQEIKDFINWMISGNFIFLGIKEFKIESASDGTYVLQDEGASLGVFRSSYNDFRPEVINASVREVCDSVKNPYIIEILKSRYRSRIHRIANAERIRIQKISSDGKIVGEIRFIGLFTSSAYNANVNYIPIVKNKINKVIKDSGYIEGSHNYKELVTALESYPRDELFQTSTTDLLKNAVGIVSICGRSQIKFFARKDKFLRFISCLIFMPKERSNSDLRERIKLYLQEIYNGEVADSFIQITDSNLLRFHVTVRTDNGIPQVSESLVEAKLEQMCRVWSDDLLASMKKEFGSDRYLNLFTRYRNAFSVSYVNRFSACGAIRDIAHIENCLLKNSIQFDLSQDGEEDKSILELKIYYPHKELTLSSIMPVLESFGFNVIQEHTYLVTTEEDGKNKLKQKAWIHYFRLDSEIAPDKDLPESIKQNFEEAASMIWAGEFQVDALNKLIFVANLSWREVFLLRAYTKYLHQIGFRYALSRIVESLAKYSQITKALVELFTVKFNPALDLDLEKRKAAIAKLSESLLRSFKKISDLNDDIIIRKFYELIIATLRTNYYQVANINHHLSVGNDFKSYISLKFDCHKISGLPLPVLYVEIFIFSSRVEGVHLRGGKVARGGLRWSDRHDDFRTEILGLVKAQMTKNAVIVPVGSKGGFVLKRNLTLASREEVQQEAIECYKTFLRGLLDLTDNVVMGQIQHPQNVVRHDGDDPYLVVAADKGTATFSDIANSVSAEYGFWLGDAFASGGSVGYDHKKMGITAKGAWISVVRHFAEMGFDVQKEEFTTIGIGDLSGDVFGNGMLLSDCNKLVAAFNHIHIFLDPNPDPKKSFTERQRMFNLPRSTWQEYDKSLISEGGGVFERSAKTIKISPEVKQALAIENLTSDELTPNELIRAILKAPVDLLWNGGIGTYVKSLEESNAEVGDRSNDEIRINGSQLRCKIVGEGGNLGFTQKGRIEYALSQGRINTDAMDNSAGVDCSDHEVNIKIALAFALASGKISLDERNQILESMTDEVSALVLKDNQLQTQAISIVQHQGMDLAGEQSRFLDTLENAGMLNRDMEFLPSRKEIEKRVLANISLTRPELCVMLAYSKMGIYNKILSSDLVKDEYFLEMLFSYFPKLMREKFADEIRHHKLKDEIIATQITNFVINRAGITAINQISLDTGFDLANVVKNLIIACEIFSLFEIFEQIEKLDGKVDSQLQFQMFLGANKLMEYATSWLLRHYHSSNHLVGKVVSIFKEQILALSNFLSSALDDGAKNLLELKIKEFSDGGVPADLALKVARLDFIASTFDICEIANNVKLSSERIAKIYFFVGDRFSLSWLREKVAKLSPANYWQRLSSKVLIDELYHQQMLLAKTIVESGCKDRTNSCNLEVVEAWIKQESLLINRFDSFITEFKIQPNLDLSAFMVVVSRLKSLIK